MVDSVHSTPAHKAGSRGEKSVEKSEPKKWRSFLDKNTMDLKVPKSFTHKINILFQGFTKYYLVAGMLQLDLSSGESCKNASLPLFDL